MNWGKWIIVSFLLFAAFIGFLVFICVREDINLVSKNYYKEELVYQKQIDRLNNTNELLEKPVMHLAAGILEIQFSRFQEVERGEVRLFRPSDIRFDKMFILSESVENARRIDVRDLPKGMYHARMQWFMNGKEYFLEDTISL